MSVNYSDGLSPYHNKGMCGLPEKFDPPEVVEERVKTLASWIAQASCVVVHCGAGISTAAGIPDFRGPRGVWTLEKKAARVKKLKGNDDEIKNVEEEVRRSMISFDEARPTLTHMALLSLIKSNRIHYIVSQNVDGLFLKTGIERDFISELHGNFFLSECNQCSTRFIRNTASKTMGLRVDPSPEATCKREGRPCRGQLRDTILDWEDELPPDELNLAEKYARRADLSIALGTTLQIQPAGRLPFLARKRPNGKTVIVNLQNTKFDKKASLVIHDYVDNVLTLLCKELSVEIEKYDPQRDPTKCLENLSAQWTRR